MKLCRGFRAGGRQRRDQIATAALYHFLFSSGDVVSGFLFYYLFVWVFFDLLGFILVVFLLFFFYKESFVFPSEALVAKEKH